MPDVLTPEQRRLNMSRVRGKDTKPELILRKGLHAAGFRYRLHARDLPGRPDLVFPRFHAAIMVHGCFWHGHTCPMFRLPETRHDFWSAKIRGNKARDETAIACLTASGWRVLTIWECSVRGKARLALPALIERSAGFLTGEQQLDEIEGNWQGIVVARRPPDPTLIITD